VDRARSLAGSAAATALPGWAVESEQRFGAGMDDDLNTPVALVAVFDLVSEGFRALQESRLTPGEAAALLGLIARFDTVLAILLPAQTELDAKLQDLLDQRQRFRAEKNWKESDRIRDELASLGWTVKDTPQGPKLVRK
jgi:cysteinyl-tRNA synthetase